MSSNTHVYTQLISSEIVLATNFRESCLIYCTICRAFISGFEDILGVNAQSTNYPEPKDRRSIGKYM